MFEILEKFWFSSPMATVGLVIVDTGREVKAYIGALQFVMDPDTDAQTVAEHGAPCPLVMALTQCGPLTWARAALYEPAIAAMFAQAPVKPDPPWTNADVAKMRVNPMAQVMPCGCTAIQASNCWPHFGMSKNLMCHWRGADAGHQVGRPRDAQGPDVGRRATSVETIDTGTPAACNCTPAENHRCYFIQALGRPGCVHEAEIRAQMAIQPPAPADGLAHEE